MSQYFYDMIPAEEFRQLSYIPTVAEFVAWIGEKYADNPAISDLNQTLSYRQMCERIARRRAFIESLGLPKGAHIAIFDRNSQDAIELFLAVTSAGYVAMNLPSALPEPAVAGSCRKFDIAAIFVRDEFAPLCAKRIELAKNETASGQAFEVWYETAEQRMSLPEETLFYDNEPALTAARLAYLEANRAALFGCARA